MIDILFSYELEKKIRFPVFFHAYIFTVLIKIYKIISKSKILQLEGGERLFMYTHDAAFSKNDHNLGIH